MYGNASIVGENKSIRTLLPSPISIPYIHLKIQEFISTHKTPGAAECKTEYTKSDFSFFSYCSVVKRSVFLVVFVKNCYGKFQTDNEESSMNSLDSFLSFNAHRFWPIFFHL